MALIYYRKPSLGIDLTAFTCTDTGSTCAHYKHSPLPAYGLN
jgi:hypothetical protein